MNSLNSTAANGTKFWVQFKQAAVIVNGGILLFAGINLYKGNEKFYKEIAMPLMHLINPEVAHNITIKLVKYKCVPKPQIPDPPTLKTQVWGRSFSNPIGMAAGFDKQGEAVDGLLKIGFGFVEVGSVTPEPQPGNPKPRVFRLPEDKAVINRFGFNSDGHEKVYTRLKSRTMALDSSGYEPTYLGDERNRANINFWTQTEDSSSKKSEWSWMKIMNRSKHFNRTEHGIVGVNLGKNKTSPDVVDDYVRGIRKFGSLADYLVVNVSSPNTPGLRDMQRQEELSKLLYKVLEERDKLTVNPKPPLLIKIAPDLTEEEKKDIASVVTRPECKVDGMIISNTTVSRPSSLVSANKNQEGGLSGTPLKDISVELIKDMYKLTKGQIPIVGVGGISTGEDAYAKVKAGASLIQLYTSLVYQGPPVLSKIKRELDELLRQDGYSNISQAVGADHKSSPDKKS